MSKQRQRLPRPPVAAGSHTLQICVLEVLNRRPGLARPPVTFDVDQTGNREFVCHPPKFLLASRPKYPACVLRERDWWIELERAR